jgi:hypothetical protein
MGARARAWTRVHFCFFGVIFSVNRHQPILDVENNLSKVAETQAAETFFFDLYLNFLILLHY